jgi:dihydroorotate dehydrogenase (NAD+) catalytic subunit
MALTLNAGKRDLTLDPPWTNAAGILGFSDEARDLVDCSRLGALVTNPVSLAPRSPAHGPRMLEFPGGFLLHTGHPNPGLTEVLRRHRRRWARLPCPVILHLLAQSPEDAGWMAERLEAVEEVAAVELGLTEIDPAMTAAMMSAAARSQRPIIAHLSIGSGVQLAQAAVRAGAVAVALGPPRGALPAPGGGTVHGRLYGPAVFPAALQAVTELAHVLDCPLFAGGGITSRQAAEAMLAAGASGLQFDSVLWTEPEAVLRPR